MNKFYTCAEVAEIYSVTLQTVWDWIRAKKLPAIRTGKLYRVSQEDIRTFNEERKTQ